MNMKRGYPFSLVCFGEGAKSRDQGFGERLYVATRHGAKKDELEQFILAQGIGAAFAEAVAQPFPVAEIMRRADAFGRFRHAAPGPAALQGG